MTQIKIKNITIEGLISFLIASIVATMLKTSERFTSFAHNLNIESDWGVNLLASIIALVAGGVVLLTLTKFFKKRKNTKR